MDDHLVFLTEYPIDNDLIKELADKGAEIREQDIDTDILQILRDNKIEYKIKLEEKWSDEQIIKDYSLVAEVYVNKLDYEHALNLLSSNQTITDNVDDLINAVEIPDDEDDFVEDKAYPENKKEESESSFTDNDNNQNIEFEKDNNDFDEAIKNQQNHIPGIISSIILLTLIVLAICYLSGLFDF